MKNIFFSSSRQHIDDFYSFSMKNELESAGYNILNLQPFTFNRNESPEYLINKCDIFIAFIKYPEPNLFFEIGYAVALAKKIIIISSLEEEIPSFLRNYELIKPDPYYQNSPKQIISLLRDVKFTSSNDFIYPKSLKKFIKLFKEQPQIIEKITESEFEKIFTDYFQSHTEFKPTPPQAPHEYGYDIALNNYQGYSKTLVEIKKYNPNSKVSIGVLQQLVGAMSLYKADRGILITTSTFTLSAVNFAKSLPHPIELWDINYIESLFE